MSSGPPPDEPRVTVLLAASAAAAAAAVREATAALGAGRPVKRIDPPAGSATLSALEAAEPASVLIARGGAAEWLALARTRPDLLRLVHLRPALVAVHDAVGRPWPEGSARAARWRALLDDDRALDGFPVLAEDALFTQPSRFREDLAALLDARPPPVEEGGAAVGGADPPGYAEALRETLGSDAHASAPPTRWATGGVFDVREGGGGAAFLASGWSHVEVDRVWTDGDRAVVVLPPVPTGRVQVCTLSGQLAHRSDGVVAVEVSSGGRPLGAVARAPGEPADVALTLRTPGPADGGPLRLDLAFTGLVRVCDEHGGDDRRRLGLALMRVELRDGGAPPPPGLDGAVEAQVGRVVLGDRRTAAAWFAAQQPGGPTPSVLIAGGEPRDWPDGLERYAERARARIEIDDAWTRLEAGGAS